jgi:hypothetical protein
MYKRFFSLYNRYYIMMENVNMTMTAEQKAARLELIKAVAAKVEKRKAFKARQAANAAKVRRWTDVEEKPRRSAKAAEFDRMIEKLDENHNAWTDAPKYAEQYYGEVMRETTKFDNDWN